jgi:hypothetical protein
VVSRCGVALLDSVRYRLMSENQWWRLYVCSLWLERFKTAFFRGMTENG